MAGAGLYDSVLNVKSGELDFLKNAILSVWLSLYSKRAIISRKQLGIPTEFAQMAIVAQRMIDSEFSFIMHSSDPITKNSDIVYIELACGQGETLASANQAGTPYRVQYSKKNKGVKVLSHSSYSYGLYASKDGDDLVKKTIDYS